MIRILVVEDSLPVMDIICAALTKAGYSVAKAVNGEDALCLTTAEKFDVIVLDLVLPGLSGYNVAERLGENAPPIIAMSGGLLDWEKFTSRKPTRFIQKPFQPQELLSVISEVLGTKEPDCLPLDPTLPQR